MGLKPLERTCDRCRKPYILNGQQIPRIIIKKKVVLNDLTAKDSYANPDLCSNCVIQILTFMKINLKFSLGNNQNNYLLTKEEQEIINIIKKY